MTRFAIRLVVWGVSTWLTAPVFSTEIEVFESDTAGSYDVYAQLKGKPPIRLTRSAHDDRQPALAGHSKTVAFSSNRGGDNEIFIIDIDGSAEIQLTENNWDDIRPVWAAGDSQIVFVSDREGIRDLYVMRSDGSGQRALPRGENVEYEPGWSADMLDRDYPPSAWLETTTVRMNRVRFSLRGTADREEGREISGRLVFGDQTDTTFSRVPERVDHDYREEGTYSVALHVRDSRGQENTIYLDLVLRPGIHIGGLRSEDWREYPSRPLDR